MKTTWLSSITNVVLIKTKFSSISLKNISLPLTWCQTTGNLRRKKVNAVTDKLRSALRKSALGTQGLRQACAQRSNTYLMCQGTRTEKH